MPQTEDEIVSAGQPYFRVVQPRTANSAFTESSYLRLGSYVAGEGTAMPTGLKTTTSSVAASSPGAEAQAADAKANVKGDPAKQYTMTSQAKDSYKTETAKDPKTGLEIQTASTNDGVLIYTDADLNENIKGAALQKYGMGHVVEVAAADAKYTVKTGKLDIGATNGIFVKAGSFKPGVEANSSSLDVKSNLELTATGYIKQTAYGPLDEITYGVTRKNFHGDAYDEFHGYKKSTFHGREHTYKLSGVMSMTLSGELVLKLSTKFELTAGIDTGIRLALDIKLFIGGKIDFVVGLDYKAVLGHSTKLVGGPDFKSAVSDMKILATSDVKFAPLADMKKVGFNITVCDFSFTKQFVKADSVYAGILKKDLEAKYSSLEGHTSGLISKIAGLHNLT